MHGFGLLLRKELTEMVRTRRLPVVLIVFTLLGLVSPVVARYIKEIVSAAGGTGLEAAIPEPVAGDAVRQLTRNLGQFGTFIAILIAMGSVAGEKERGTAVFLLTKPIGRDAFLAAKVVALGLLLALATALAGVACWFYTAVLFEPLPLAGFVAAMAMLWLSLAAFAAITFAASVLAPSALVAGGIGVAALLLGGFLSVITSIAPYLPTGLWGLADELAIGNLPDPLIGPLVVNAAIIGLALALAWWSFRRQEL